MTIKRSLFSLLTIILSSLLLISCSSLRHNTIMKPSAQQLVQHEGESTVALVFDTGDSDDAANPEIKTFCSGVWINETQILTANHCVKALQERLQSIQDDKEQNAPTCEPLQALFGMCVPGEATEHKIIGLKNLPIHFVQWRESAGIGKEPFAIHLSKVTAWSKERDLAVLDAADKLLPAHDWAPLAKRTPMVTSPVQIVGHPSGLVWTFLTGTIAGYREEIPVIKAEGRIGPFVQIQAPIYFGNSGGGVFDEYGNLVGIASFMMRAPSEGFFISVESIKSFVKDNGIITK